VITPLTSLATRLTALPVTPYPPDFLPPAPARRLTVRSADGTRIAVQLHEPQAVAPVDGATRAGNRPTVVLVHGWTCSTTFWVRVVHRLRPDLRVVVYDQRGHGRSGPVPDGGFTPGAVAADLAAVLDATVAPGERAVVAGHSMGAMALVAFAGRYPDQLHRQVAAGLLASTGVEQLMGRMAVLPRLRHDPRAADGSRDGRPVGARAEALARFTIGSGRSVHRMPLRLARATLVHATMSRSATPAERAFCTDIVLACQQRTYQGFAEMLGTLDLSADLRRLDVPATVLVGTRDRLTPPWHARRLAAALPRPVGLVELPGSGHMTPLTEPDVVATEIRRLAALTADPTPTDATPAHRS
jgi:pimeloyl-ACP methyl ester carboxylesterase